MTVISKQVDYTSSNVVRTMGAGSRMQPVDSNVRLRNSTRTISGCLPCTTRCNRRRGFFYHSPDPGCSGVLPARSGFADISRKRPGGAHRHR